MPSTGTTLTAALAHVVDGSSPSLLGLTSSSKPAGSSGATPLSASAAASAAAAAAATTVASVTTAPPVEEAALVPKIEPGRFHFVVSDPVAFYYLDRDPCVKVVNPELTLEGYEIYLVEQWACSRSHPSFTIATYTGHPSHKILVGVLSILENEAEWGRDLVDYFRFVRFYGREKNTPFGKLMVTNLSNLSPDLTVIIVPDGDVASHRRDFIVNEDLKRMGCTGRSALTLSMPSDAAQAKFHQLFHTSDQVPFYDAVTELVRLCQLALVMFQKLDKHFADGLLCDETEKAISAWWSEIGGDFYNVEPSDGIFGPTTVAALLGMMIGARNRLSSCGAPVPKDAFDLSALKSAIGYFQKQYKLDRTRRLDRETVYKLHRVTLKSASTDKYGMVPKAIKTTVAEMAGRTQRVEMETCDMEKFITHLSGERAKYLWYGKPIKSASAPGTMSSDPNSRVNSLPLPASLGRSAGLRAGKEAGLSTGQSPSKNDSSQNSTSDAPPAFIGAAAAYAVGQHVYQPPVVENRDPLRKTMFKTMNNRMNDAKSGLGKIKDVATGAAWRHQRKQTKDDVPALSEEDQKQAIHQGNIAATLSAPMIDLPKLSPAFLASDDPTRSDPSNIHMLNHHHPGHNGEYTDSPTTTVMKTPFDVSSPKPSVYSDSTLQTFERNASGEVLIKTKDGRIPLKQAGTAETSLAGSAKPANGLPKVPGPIPGLDFDGTVRPALLRTHSFSSFEGKDWQRHEDYYPRRLSFSIAEDAVLDWQRLGEDDEGSIPYPDEAQDTILRLEHGEAAWTAQMLKEAEAFVPRVEGEIKSMKQEYRDDKELYDQLEDYSTELIARETQILMDELREVELLRPKLHYQINALEAKIEEVEEAVFSFGKQVEELEERLEQLDPSSEKPGWLQWVLEGGPWRTTA